MSQSENTGSFLFQATRDTYLKRTARKSSHLYNIGKVPVRRGAILECHRVVVGKRHLLLGNARLDGVALRASLKFAYKSHWKPLPQLAAPSSQPKRHASSSRPLLELDSNFVHFYEVDSPTLVVTFDYFGATELAYKPWGGKFIQENGWSLVGVTSKKKNWFRSPDLHEFLIGFRDSGGFSGYDKVVFAGPSMGGFGAGVFSGLSRGSVIVTTSPQSTLDPNLVPFEKRYDREHRLNWSGLFADAAVESASASKIYVAYDPLVIPDKLHVDRLPQVNLVRFEIPHLGHTIVSSLLKMNLLKAFMRKGIEGTLSESFTDDARRLRRLDEKYYRNLIKHLDRTGRSGLAGHVRTLSRY